MGLPLTVGRQRSIFAKIAPIIGQELPKAKDNSLAAIFRSSLLRGESDRSIGDCHGFRPVIVSKSGHVDP